MLAFGLGDTLKNQEIMEFRVSGLLDNEIGILSYRSQAEKSIKLLKVLFKYITPINGPKTARTNPILFPISFHEAEWAI